MNYRPISGIPPVVKNLLIINVLVFFFTWVLEKNFNFDLTNLLGLHYWKSEAFYPHQLITYMFMHGGFSHIFFNMFAVFMFGRALETIWGGKRFLLFYMITGIGAGLVQLLVIHFRLMSLYDAVPPEQLEHILTNGYDALRAGKNYTEALSGKINLLINTTTVGASGAVFGILLAFGMLFPNTMIMLLIPPIPLKAKYFVIIYGVVELFLGIQNYSGDNVAHFAHLGGMLFGFILIKYWNKNSKSFY